VVAHINKVITDHGFTAYRDDVDSRLIWYMPGQGELTKGETLIEFKNTYWGIGKPFYAQTPTGIKSVIGSILSGTMKFDINSSQRQKLLANIKEVWGITDPILSPLQLYDVEVEPVFSTHTLEIDPEAKIIFPKTLTIGSTFNYLIESNGLFASFVASEFREGEGLTTTSDFGVNITGYGEFTGDPWEAEVEADLSEVWKYVRTAVSSEFSAGWYVFTTAQYECIVSELTRNSVIKLTLKEGSLNLEEQGRQVFEMARVVLEQVNVAANTNTGLLRFVRVQEPLAINTPTPLGWGWRLSVNLAFSEQSLTSSNTINYRNTISYQGRFRHLLTSSMNLAVECNSETGRYFQDLGNLNEPCVTQAKQDIMQERLRDEIEFLDSLIRILKRRYANGEITIEELNESIDLLSSGVSGFGFSTIPDGTIVLANGKTVNQLGAGKTSYMYENEKITADQIINLARLELVREYRQLLHQIAEIVLKDS